MTMKRILFAAGIAVLAVLPAAQVNRRRFRFGAHDTRLRQAFAAAAVHRRLANLGLHQWRAIRRANGPGIDQGRSDWRPSVGAPGSRSIRSRSSRYQRGARQRLSKIANNAVMKNRARTAPIWSTDEREQHCAWSR
jgi:hypothetical protein